MNDITSITQTRSARLKCSFSTVEAIGTVVLWVILTIVTLGLALLVFPYYLNKAVLNKTEVLDASGKTAGRLTAHSTSAIPLVT
ncbi:hypothetical protein N7379_08890 [Rhizobium pusense]|nr:DUF6693 family protein [Agrobacterium pusense]MDH0114598.1 hypothetical protein [Agrobacterium pusense]